MSRQPSRQVDSPRKLTTRPASTPITTINSGHCRSDLAAALASGRGTSHQMFGTFDDVAEQHGPRHRPDPARHRRHPRRDLAYARIKITYQAVVGTGDAVAGIAYGLLLGDRRGRLLVIETPATL